MAEQQQQQHQHHQHRDDESAQHEDDHEMHDDEDDHPDCLMCQWHAEEDDSAQHTASGGGGKASAAAAEGGESSDSEDEALANPPEEEEDTSEDEDDNIPISHLGKRHRKDTEKQTKRSSKASSSSATKDNQKQTPSSSSQQPSAPKKQKMQPGLPTRYHVKAQVRSSAKDRSEVLKETEAGSVYWFYRPAQGVDTISQAADVAHCYMMLVPEDKNAQARLVKIPKKRMPKKSPRITFVAKVGSVPELVKFLGSQSSQTPVTKQTSTWASARLVAKGFYSLFQHNHEGKPESAAHTHLAYKLVAPGTRLGPAQRLLGLYPEASMVAVAHNPHFWTPLGLGAKLPEKVQNQFAGVRKKERKTTKLEPELLDHEKVEIVLVGNKPVLDRNHTVLHNLAAFAEAHTQAILDGGGNVLDSVWNELGLGDEFKREPLFEGRIV